MRIYSVLEKSNSLRVMLKKELACYCYVYVYIHIICVNYLTQVGEDYIPYKKEVRGKVYKPKESVQPVKKETKKSKFAEELDQMLSLVDQDDLADLASKTDA